MRAPSRSRKGFHRVLIVGLALGLVKGKQDRKEFEQLLQRALAIDPEKNPDNRLVTLITQKRARLFLDHIGDLFLEDSDAR